MSVSDLQNLVPAGAIEQGGNALALSDELSLRRARVHEVTGVAADMFAILAAARQDCDVIWIGLGRDVETLCPCGLQAHIGPERLIVVEAVSRGELLWATDQALGAEGRFCVIADMPDALSLKESRRLQLAAEQGGGLGLILLRGPANTSAAQTRWYCEPVMAARASWLWDCVKGKSGEAGTWRVQAAGGQNATDTLLMALAASP